MLGNHGFQKYDFPWGRGKVPGRPPGNPPQNHTFQRSAFQALGMSFKLRTALLKSSGIREPLVTVVPLLLLEAMGNQNKYGFQKYENPTCRG